jgi:DNA-binding beta-propeller fold protein YncE
VALTVALAAGCAGAVAPGQLSHQPPAFPPAAEPAVSPAVTATPVGRIVAVGAAPEGIVADPLTRTVAVGVRRPDQLVVLDAATGAVRARVGLPGVLRHLQLAGPGGPVLVPDESSNLLLRVALPEGRVLARVRTGISPHDANQAADGTVFVANEGGASVAAVRGDEVVRTFAGVTQPAGVAHVGTTVAVVDVREDDLVLYDAAALRPLMKLPAGDGPTHVVADRHARFVVIDTRGGAVLLYTLAPAPALLARVRLSGRPYGVAYDPVRDQLWVSVTATNQLVGYDMGGPVPREIVRLPTVRAPYTVAVDPASGTRYVTGTAEGTVEIIPAGDGHAVPHA